MSEALHTHSVGLTPDELHDHHLRVFLGEHGCLHKALVVPTWTLWRSFEAFAFIHGLQANPQLFRELLDRAPWASVQDRPEARGLLRSTVNGIGLKATAPRFHN